MISAGPSDDPIPTMNTRIYSISDPKGFADQLDHLEELAYWVGFRAGVCTGIIIGAAVIIGLKK